MYAYVTDRWYAMGLINADKQEKIRLRIHSIHISSYQLIWLNEFINIVQYKYYQLKLDPIKTNRILQNSLTEENTQIYDQVNITIMKIKKIYVQS